MILVFQNSIQLDPELDPEKENATIIDVQSGSLEPLFITILYTEIINVKRRLIHDTIRGAYCMYE